jgi:hypothetical protein
MTPSAVQKIISNTMRKEYVTEAEFRHLLNQRKSTP